MWRAYRVREVLRVVLGIGLLGAFSVSAVPIVTEIDPPFGNPGSQETIALYGSGLSGALVFFNGVRDTTANATSSGQINAKVPVLATTGPITVTVGGASFVTTNDFVVLRGQPYVASFYPLSGQTNTEVSLYGKNLDATTKVWFSGALAGTPLTGPAIGQIRVKIPAGAVPGPITASNQWSSAYGTFITSSNFFPIGGGPLITDFSPVRGAPGTEVVINGLNFYNGSTVVRFGTNQVSQLVFTAGTQIHAWVPANAVTAPISVVTPYGTNTTSTNFLIGYAPEVLGFSPGYGPAGTHVTIDGVNFITGGTAVKLNGTNVAAVSVTSPTQLQATIQANASTGHFVVSTAFGTNASSSNFVVTGSAPLISGFSPPNGSIGAQIVIDGDNLIDATNVLFGGVRSLSFHAVSRTQINAFVPEGATNGSVTVLNPYGAATTSSNFFLPPVIVSLSPSNAPVQAVITIAGTNLSGASEVRFNGRVGGFSVVDNNTLQATVPINATAGFVTVTTPGGTVDSAQVFQIAPSADLAVRIAVDRSPATVGESVLLTAVVTNAGPNGATNLLLKLDVPFFLAVQSASASAGSVATNSMGGTASLGSLARSNSWTLNLKCRVTALANPPIGAAATATITAATADLFQADNSATLVVFVETSPVLKILQGSQTNVVLSWPSQWSNFTVQAVGQLLAGSSWQTLTNVPSLSGSELRITRPATNQQQFFRLSRPAP
jgi:large repetitive protein